MHASAGRGAGFARALTGIVGALGILLAALNAIVGIGGPAVANLVLPVFGEVVLLGAVTVILRRAATRPHDRWAWAAIGAGALAWAAGDIYRQIAFPAGDHRYFPSPADAGYLLMYPFTYVGMWLLVRGRSARFRRSLWLDGLIGATGVAALGIALVIHVVANASSTRSSLATNVAYPLADIILLAQLFAALGMAGWRAGRTWLFLGLGLGLFATGDAAYAYAAATGHTYVVAIGPAWIIAFVLIAVAARQREETPERATRHDGLAVLLGPTVFTLVAIALLVVGQRHHLPPDAYGFAVLTLLLVMVRMALTFRENIALLDSRRAALTDELTELANRRHLGQRLGECIASADGEPFAGLLLIDLDRFKELNDTLGHHAGDLLLVELGRRLVRLAGVDLVARLGGDEFAMIVSGEPRPEILHAAALRVRAALTEPFLSEGLTLHVGASIGGALHPEHGSSPAELMRHADVAMYAAKGAHSEYELYRPERDLHSRERLRLAGELQRALDEHELVVHYQPQAHAGSGRITAVEALVRWEHPTEGLITPDRFLEVAERAGLMGRLTSYVLERALRQLAEWNARGADLSVAVNLAMPNLLDLRLPEEVSRLLALTGVPAERLTLEITENVVIADPGRILGIVGRLKHLGVGLSLDDFGAGASTLSYIRRLTINELKIDRSFVMAMEKDQDCAAIVRATIELAHSLGLTVVAEGVETTEALGRLRALGCDQIQGYLLNRPRSAEDLAGQLFGEEHSPLPVAAAAAPPRR